MYVDLGVIWCRKNVAFRKRAGRYKKIFLRVRSGHSLCELEELPDLKCLLLTVDEGASKGEQSGKLFRVGAKKKKKNKKT